MDNNQLTRLKEVLSVPTKTYQEDNMVQYLRDVLDAMPDVEHYTDDMGNVYATKGVLNEGECYPMFIAHTDTVHALVDEIVVREETLVKPNTFGLKFDDQTFLSLKGYTPDGEPTGIGGDDKCGVFIALELLRTLSKVKVGLFVSEETGCHGSSKCDPNFLNDVGYAIQFDAPGNALITELCSGVRLYEKDGEFINKLKPIFEQSMGTVSDEQSHPYTDVSQIKRKGDFSCINFSCGYYNMHTVQEFVVIDDVKRALEFAENAVSSLGYVKYPYEYQQPTWKSYGDLFDIDDFDDDFSEDKIDMERLIVTTSDEGMTIESKFSGDLIELDDEEMLDIYEAIKSHLMSKYTH
jgi:putative aminopeptidase FrvX